ncbi:MAG: DUF697 domain-containing protein [Bacteroidia bacterium]|nr:DUF697 domain-containing protein [Bacteroidia bacterium]MCX7651788.1 DUF697 domain-containing protein [Bacteroidia bacterium]MDW8416340.1 DUF697 domain-containing protein [Bacteroidia bacterium]
MEEEKRQRAEKLIREHMIVAMGAGLVPLPFADWATTTAVQLNLVRKLAKVYDVPFFSGLAKGLIASLVGATAVRGGASLVKLIPGIGWMMGGLTASALAAATTYGVGKVFAEHFASGGTLRDFDTNTAKRAYERAFREGQKVYEDVRNQPPTPTPEDPYEQLRKLYELHKAGVLTAEEYEAQKRKILERL